MAKSPFQTSGNVADIAPVQLRGGFTPAPGLASVVADVAKVVVPAIRQNFEDNLVNDVQEQTQAVSLALKATRFPSIQSSIFSEEALANPVVANALKEFTLIQDAAAQGRLPSNFVLERLELIQNTAIKDAPAFSREIRGAMQDATGVSPQKALFARLMAETAATKTPEQQQLDKDRAEASGFGITVDALRGVKLASFTAAAELQQYDLAAQRGTYDLRMQASDIRVRSSLITTDLMGAVRKLVVSGQNIGVEEKLQLSNLVNSAFGAATAQITAKSQGLNVSGTAVDAELKPLITHRDNLLGMIEDNTIASMMSEHNDVLVAESTNTVLNNTEYGTVFAALGGRGLLEFFELEASLKSSPEAKALRGMFDSRAAGLFKFGDIIKQYSKVGTAVVPDSTEDRALRLMAAGLVMKAKEVPEEVKLGALADLDTYGAEGLAWSSFESDGVLSATATSSKVKAAFINLQLTTSAGLSEELVQVASTAGIKMEQLVQSEDGSLTVNESIGAHESRGRDSGEARADAVMHDFVKRFNRANRISAKYQAAGILPSSRYSGAKDYWNTIRKAASEVVGGGAEPEEVIEYEINSDGVAVPINGGL